MAFATTLAGITSKYRGARSLFDPGCLQIPINSEQLPWPEPMGVSPFKRVSERTWCYFRCAGTSEIRAFPRHAVRLSGLYILLKNSAARVVSGDRHYMLNASQNVRCDPPLSYEDVNAGRCMDDIVQGAQGYLTAKWGFRNGADGSGHTHGVRGKRLADHAC